jgi:hypothetical protein
VGWMAAELRTVGSMGVGRLLGILRVAVSLNIDWECSWPRANMARVAPAYPGADGAGNKTPAWNPSSKSAYSVAPVSDVSSEDSFNIWYDFPIAAPAYPGPTDASASWDTERKPEAGGSSGYDRPDYSRGRPAENRFGGGHQQDRYSRPGPSRGAAATWDFDDAPTPRGAPTPGVSYPSFSKLSLLLTWSATSLFSQGIWILQRTVRTSGRLRQCADAGGQCPLRRCAHTRCSRWLPRPADTGSCAYSSRCGTDSRRRLSSDTRRLRWSRTDPRRELPDALERRPTIQPSAQQRARCSRRGLAPGRPGGPYCAGSADARVFPRRPVRRRTCRHHGGQRGGISAVVPRRSQLWRSAAKVCQYPIDGRGADSAQRDRSSRAAQLYREHPAELVGRKGGRPRWALSWADGHDAE